MKVDVDFFKSVDLFKDLSHEEVLSAAQAFREQKYKRGDTVFFEEDTGKYMYIVKEGRVRVSRLLPNGKEMILAFHQSGEYFGEMALIDGGTSPATVTAVVPTTILSLSAREFHELLERHSRIRQSVMRMLCRRCREAWSQIEVLTFHNADSRIRTALYHLCQRRGVPTDRGVMIDVHLTHKELADIVGISRETATRVLSNLQSEDVISVETKHFYVPDPERLVDSLIWD